ncbi:uncharacterized protein PRCAT00002800001 [Priceomyces carsonii]|uniref:uncharacterized protein n=1 Tax=Priceomyces carsonii TaxID=28549 RepID=UPI002ED94932|nr:unnamed protein product [Priceomyces carsonii]
MVNIMKTWVYTPVCVRLVSNDGKRSNESFSGAYVALRSSANILLFERIITISSIYDLSGYSLIFNCAEFNDEETVYWYRCNCDLQVPLQSLSHDLLKVLNFFKENGFKILPNDDISQLNVMSLKIKDKHSLKQSLGDLKILRFADLRVGESMFVSSYPFNFTNSLVFSRFVSKGNATCVLNSNNDVLGYLSDLKYLENMLGSVATKKSKESVGLVMGNIRKTNGDGDLLFVISWNFLWTALSSHFKRHLSGPLPPISTVRAASETLELFDNMLSVLPLVIMSKGKLFWATATYYNRSTLVTNKHVVGSFEDDPHNVVCIAYLPRGRSIRLTSSEKVISPFKHLDLTFIELSDQSRAIMDDSSMIPASFGKTYEIGDEVVAKGFGLFFDRSSIIPLESRGIISTLFRQTIDTTSDLKLPSVMVTSSPCWNGSSGGGIFNMSGQLLGIICSNAQVKSQLGEEKTLETVTEFCLCIPIDTIKQCYFKLNFDTKFDLNPKVIDIWNLNSYHDDVVLDGSKL